MDDESSEFMDSDQCDEFGLPPKLATGQRPHTLQ